MKFEWDGVSYSHGQYEDYLRIMLKDGDTFSVEEIYDVLKHFEANKSSVEIIVDCFKDYVSGTTFERIYKVWEEDGMTYIRRI